ncbi:MAG: preprotein translocase subunit SecF [Mycobacterium sp.]|nr:preprotein translocase subunit SecF [Mycobacterium sp.]
MASKPRTGAGTNKAGAKKKPPATKAKGTTKSPKVIDVELDSHIDDPKTDGPRHSFLSRLYTGTGAFEVVGRRKLWYGISGAIIGIAILAILIRGFTFGIDFKGGTTVSMPSAGTVQVSQVEDVFKKTIGKEPEAVVTVGKGSSATVQIRSETLSNEQTEKLRNALFDAFHPKGPDGNPSKKAISDAAVSETWGDQITKKAVIALVVFLVLVAIYITVRYERYMTLSALAAMIFDLTVTAGVYALVGFEVTPATVIGLLTILGFSLYDTVIVFDKVEENTNGFQHTTRRTFAEQANLAVNQTFMRSINTSLISVLPVAALMVVAVWLLGVGTLKDLALVQLIGIMVGTYSSIFFATPLLVTLRERTELVRTHTRRVLRRRNAGAVVTAEKASTSKADAKAAAKAASADIDSNEDDDASTEETVVAEDTVVAEKATSTSEPPSEAATASVEKTGDKPAVTNKPAPGARPVRPTGTRRPTGKRNVGKR